MRGGRGARALLGLLIGSSAAVTLAPALLAQDDVSTERELARLWTRPTGFSQPSAASLSRTEAIARLTGGRGVPGRCATSLLIALHQSSERLNQGARRLLERLTATPSPGQALVRVSPGGEFRLHYSTRADLIDRVDPSDADLNGVPDGVDRIASELSDVLADFVHELDWAPSPAPGAASGQGVDVYLVSGRDSGGRMELFVAPKGHAQTPSAAASQAPEAADAAIYLDVSLASTGAVSRPAVAHAVAHMVLLRESSRESAWWHEASATWLENRLERNADAVARALGSSRYRRARGLLDEPIGLTLESFLWPHYLSLSLGQGTPLLMKIWGEQAAVPGNNTLEAIDRILKRSADSSLAEELKIFNIWNLFLGRADDGAHYPFGSLLPTPDGDASFDLYPARGVSAAGPLQPSGAALVRLLADGSPGGLRIGFAGGETGQWDVSLLIHPSGGPGGVRMVPLEVQSDGRGTLSIPWRSLAAVDLIVQNMAGAGATPSDFSYWVEHDESIPFDLLAFSAAGDASGASLTWSTDGEDRLAGWNLYRSTSLLGPFSRINQYLVPAAGHPGRPMDYQFLDDSVEPGRKYYYYLEGVTFEGLTERSHASGVRTGRGSSRGDAAPR